jgi:hypothetical protein
MKQFVVTYTHSEKMLAHVGLFNERFKSEKTNHGWTFVAQCGKAKYAMRHASGNHSAQHTFDSGFHVALMNTGMVGWETTKLDGSFDMPAAVAERARVIAELTDQGYNRITHIRGKMVHMTGEVGNRGWGAPIKDSMKKLNAKNLLMDDVKVIVDKLCVGIVLTDEQRTEAKNYIANCICYPKPELDNFEYRGEVWSYLNSLAWPVEVAMAA